MISVMLMACSVSDKKSPRRGKRAEPQSTDSRRQTRRKHASRTLERLDLSSCYFLKRSKIDISRNVNFFGCIERSQGDPRRRVEGRSASLCGKLELTPSRGQANRLKYVFLRLNVTREYADDCRVRRICLIIVVSLIL